MHDIGDKEAFPAGVIENPVRLADGADAKNPAHRRWYAQAKARVESLNSDRVKVRTVGLGVLASTATQN